MSESKNNKESKQVKYVTIAIVVVGLLMISYFIFLAPDRSKIENEDTYSISDVGEYDEFAQCLDATGMKMYGSVTCSFCERQRELFGSSFQYIEEIECDPRNEDNEAERCIAKDISHTPTWILEDAKGNDLYRFESGPQSLADLAEASGCQLP
ncbi:MAG: hypothetical protein Q8P90_03915 [bacterium]|nr:hypothetical protein [bacterium]